MPVYASVDGALRRLGHYRNVSGTLRRLGPGGGAPTAPGVVADFPTLDALLAAVTAADVGRTLTVADVAERDLSGGLGAFTVGDGGGTPVPGVRYVPVAALGAPETVVNTWAGGERSVSAGGPVDFRTLAVLVGPGGVGDPVAVTAERLHGHGVGDDTDPAHLGQPLLDCATGRLTVPVWLKNFSSYLRLGAVSSQNQNDPRVEFTVRPVTGALRVERVRPAIARREPDAPDGTPGATVQTTDYLAARWGWTVAGRSGKLPATLHDDFSPPPAPNDRGDNPVWFTDAQHDLTGAVDWSINAAKAMAAETGRRWRVICDGPLGQGIAGEFEYHDDVWLERLDEANERQGLHVLPGAYEHRLTAGDDDWPAAYHRERTVLDYLSKGANRSPAGAVAPGAADPGVGYLAPFIDLGPDEAEYLLASPWIDDSPATANPNVPSKTHDVLRHTLAGNVVGMDLHAPSRSARPPARFFVGGVFRCRAVNNGVNGKTANTLYGPGRLDVYGGMHNHGNYSTGASVNDQTLSGNRYSGPVLVQHIVVYNDRQEDVTVASPGRANPVPTYNGLTELISKREEGAAVWVNVREGVYDSDDHSAHRNGHLAAYPGLTLDMTEANAAGRPGPAGVARMEGGILCVSGFDVVGTPPDDLYGVQNAPNWQALTDEPSVCIMRAVGAVPMKSFCAPSADRIEITGTPIPPGTGEVQRIQPGNPDHPRRVVIEIAPPGGNGGPKWNNGVTMNDPTGDASGGTANTEVFVRGGTFPVSGNVVHRDGTLDPAWASTLKMYWDGVALPKRITQYTGSQYYRGVTCEDTGRTSEDSGVFPNLTPTPDGAGGSYIDVPVNLFEFSQARSVVAVTGVSAGRFTGVSSNQGTTSAPVLRFAFTGTDPVEAEWTAAVNPVPQAVLDAWPDHAVGVHVDYPRGPVVAGEVLRLSAAALGGVAPFTLTLDLDGDATTWENVGEFGERELRVAPAPGSRTLTATTTDAEGTVRQEVVTFNAF